MSPAIPRGDRDKAGRESIGFESDLFGPGYRVIVPVVLPADGSHVVLLFEPATEQGSRPAGKPLCRPELLPVGI